MRQTTFESSQSRNLLPHLFEIIFKKLIVYFVSRFVLLFEIYLLNHIVNDKDVAALERHKSESLNHNVDKTTEISHKLLTGVNFPGMINHLRGNEEVVTHKNPPFINLR